MEKLYIRVPRPVTIKAIDDVNVVGPDGAPVVVDFVVFVKGRCSDPVFASGGMKSIVSAQQIIVSLVGITEGMIWAIDRDNYDLLLKSVETPADPYIPRFAWSLIPHMNAVKDATREHPEEKAP